MSARNRRMKTHKSSRHWVHLLVVAATLLVGAFASAEPPTASSPGGHVAAELDETSGATVDAPSAAPDVSTDTVASPSASIAPSLNSRPLGVAPFPEMFPRATTWDMNIDLGYGLLFTDDKPKNPFARLRGGVMFVRDSVFTSLGLTYEVSRLQTVTFGVQGETLHLESGGWLQLGLLVDRGARFGGMGALGWSLFGVEAQYRGFPDIDPGFALYAKLRIPIGIMAYAARKR